MPAGVETFYFIKPYFNCSGLERDLAALGDKIRQLDETANRLMQTHPDSADVIYAKQAEINEQWTQLTAKVSIPHTFLFHSALETVSRPGCLFHSEFMFGQTLYTISRIISWNVVSHSETDTERARCHMQL